MTGHVHCYGEFPGEITWCWDGATAPVLDPETIIEVKGEQYHALPTFVGTKLVVQRDRHNAQVAIKARREPSGSELTEKELVGAGASTE